MDMHWFFLSAGSVSALWLRIRFRIQWAKPQKGKRDKFNVRADRFFYLKKVFFGCKIWRYLIIKTLDLDPHWNQWGFTTLIETVGIHKKDIFIIRKPAWKSFLCCSTGTVTYVSFYTLGAGINVPDSLHCASWVSGSVSAWNVNRIFSMAKQRRFRSSRSHACKFLQSPAKSEKQYKPGWLGKGFAVVP